MNKNYFTRNKYHQTRPQLSMDIQSMSTRRQTQVATKKPSLVAGNFGNYGTKEMFLKCGRRNDRWTLGLGFTDDFDVAAHRRTIIIWYDLGAQRTKRSIFHLHKVSIVVVLSFGYRIKKSLLDSGGYFGFGCTRDLYKWRNLSGNFLFDFQRIRCYCHVCITRIAVNNLSSVMMNIAVVL